MRAAASVLLVVGLSGTLGLAGCWKDELAEIPPNVLQFQPEVDDAPLGWLVAPIDVNLECPDGSKTRFYLLYEEAAAQSGEPVPAAVLYHSGSFDFVFAPDADQPLSGTHLREPNRLTTEWAIRQVFVTLGMYPEQAEDEQHDGFLPTALAERGVAVMLPANCWGDLWHNRRGGADNDFARDFFFRDGAAAGEWAYRFLVDPLFAAALNVELPIVVDPTQTYAIGLGEGGRAVGELLSIDNDDDGEPDYTPEAVLVDSSFDDLRVFWNDPGVYGNIVAGLDRIFPMGPGPEGDLGGMYSAPLPTRVGYVYSVQDPVISRDLHLASSARLGAEPDAWVYVDDAPRHVLLNGGNTLGLAGQAVDWLLDGNRPPEGPAAP
jgi:hypothetical protein